MAEYYSAELSQKVRRGMNESRRKGQFTGGYLLYGYRLEDKKLFVDEDKAEIVRYVYREYARGRIVEDIIADLTARGIYNRGKPFAKNTICHMLQNEKYAGMYHHDGEAFPDIYPRIVPEDLYEQVHRKVVENQYGKRSTEVVYLLRKKMICGYCGQTISAETGTSKTGKINYYYKCLGRKRKSNCKKSIVKKDVLEKLVVDTTIAALGEENVIDTIADAILERHAERMKNDSERNILLREKAKIRKSIDNMLSAIEKGVVTTSTKKRLDELELRLSEVEASLLSAEVKKRMFLSKNDVLRYLQNALQKDAKQMIDLLIEKIVLFDDRMEITYNYTKKKDPDEKHRDLLLFYECVSKIQIASPGLHQGHESDILIRLFI